MPADAARKAGAEGLEERLLRRKTGCQGLERRTGLEFLLGEQLRHQPWPASLNDTGEAVDLNEVDAGCNRQS